jgi:sporulation protein YunB
MIIMVFIFIIIIIFSYIIINHNIKPVITETAEAKVRAMASRAFNEAVKEVFIASVDYDSLMNVVTDNTGKVTMIQANIVAMNKMATETAIVAQNNMQQLSKNGIRIPIGSLMKGQIFSGRGPRIVIKIIPIGSITTQFKTEFEHAGINQTRHKIFLKANMRFDIVMASGNSSITVESFVPVSENIIIGEVPESFIDVNQDDLINLVPSSD